jgi:tetratricopeptide (TPR) repeat protein
LKTPALGSAVLVLAAALAACAQQRSGTSAPDHVSGLPPDAGSGLTPDHVSGLPPDAGSGLPASPAAKGARLPFIEDDYGRALSEARARGLPLFIDAWATWCHSCLSMRSYVLSDPSLQALSSRFVWLSLDTERAENAPAVTRLGVKVLPTLFVVDPTSERTRIAHEGSLTASELARLLESEEAGAGGTPEATATRLASLAASKRFAECVATGADEAPRMPPGTALADVLRSAIGCATELSDRAPERARLPELVATGERVVSDPNQPILADDRSDLYDYLVDALHRLGRDDEARRLAGAWATLLEDQAAHAATPAARAVFDAHRVLAYEALGDPARALPMLQQSERDFPGDYNPPARLGKVLFDLKRNDEAIAALERALPRAYGPRKLRLWSLEADAFIAKGDEAGARRALQSALDFAASVPLTGAYPSLRDAIADRLRAL